MVKRAREDETDIGQSSVKRWRPSCPDRLSSLSDELLLKVLSFLPVSQLAVCQRLSHKYRKLSGDGQLWKSHYYDRFVRPRASRLPGLKDVGAPDERVNLASKATRWLKDDHLVKSGGNTDWRKQYKLRHNWSRGSCAVKEIPVAEKEAIPPVLVQMSDGTIYIAEEDGIRAWDVREPKELFAQISFSRSSPPRHPTALAIDSNDAKNTSIHVVVGFDDGSFSVYLLDLEGRSFGHRYHHEPSSNGVITATAVRWPYVTTMTATQLLSVHHFGDEETAHQTQEPVRARLLHSLKSNTVWPPLSMTLRTSIGAVFVCVAYALPTYLSGWTVGVQEIKLSRHGALLDSRIASAIDQHYRPLAFSTRPSVHHLMPFTASSTGMPAPELKHIHTKPTSLSYHHPYLLVSHPDNTLTLYLVTSTADSLSISPGSRLWGHTSAVSGATVGGRGKAVSISRRGELRVWELEGGFASSAARKRLAGKDLSVQVRPAGVVCAGSTASGGDEPGEDSYELTLTRGWLGFDDENVVTLKEDSQGKQALMVYDFT